jgi:hypothetical protein
MLGAVAHTGGAHLGRERTYVDDGKSLRHGVGLGRLARVSGVRAGAIPPGSSPACFRWAIPPMQAAHNTSRQACFSCNAKPPSSRYNGFPITYPVYRPTFSLRGESGLSGCRFPYRNPYLVKVDTAWHRMVHDGRHGRLDRLRRCVVNPNGGDLYGTSWHRMIRDVQKAGDATRTRNIQLGRLMLYH